MEVKVKSLEAEREDVTDGRLRRLALEKQAAQLRQELMQGQENQFFDAIAVGFGAGGAGKDIRRAGKLNTNIIRKFVIRLEEKQRM